MYYLNLLELISFFRGKPYMELFKVTKIMALDKFATVQQTDCWFLFFYFSHPVSPKSPTDSSSLLTSASVVQLHHCYIIAMMMIR